MLLGSAQTTCNAPTIPDGMALENAEDFRRADAIASKCVNWLLAHDHAECQAEFDRLNAFVLVWLSGHPDLLIEVNTDAMPFLEAHIELLYPMLHGMARYALETPVKDQNHVDAHVAGLAAVADACIADRNLRRDETLKEILKARRKGRLAAYYQYSVKID